MKSDQQRRGPSGHASKSAKGAPRPATPAERQRPQRPLRIDFRDIDFGYATAEEEGVANPGLLLKGFLDIHRVEEEALQGRRFLFLGYKGSGKSAIGEHLRLKAEIDAKLFVTSIALGDFPFAEFGQIVQGPSQGPARYPAAWSWILLLQVMGSFAKDNGAVSASDPDFIRTATVLQQLGFLPTPSLNQVVLRSSSKKFKASFPKIVEGEWGTSSESSGLNIMTAVDVLRSVVCGFDSDSDHLIVIDGLDDIFIRSDLQFESLAALVLEISRLNLAFARAQAPVKFVLLCRTDIYERLPGPNKNKIRQDGAVHLDWYLDPSKPQRSNLLALANMKARVTDPDIVDVLAEFLPPVVFNQHRTERRETRRYLLDFTRHTPRDFLQLLVHIQQISDGSGVLTSDQVRSGARNYSINYFLPEIRDELVGHLTTSQIDAGLDVLGRLQRRQFYASYFFERANAMGVGDAVAPQFLNLLFEFGALGNQVETGDGKSLYTYRYRNRQSPFNPDRKVTLHRAMLPALNIPTGV